MKILRKPDIPRTIGIRLDNIGVHFDKTPEFTVNRLVGSFWLEIYDGPFSDTRFWLNNRPGIIDIGTTNITFRLGKE